MTTYRLDIFRFGRLIGQLQSEAAWAREAVGDVAQRLPEKDGYSTKLFIAKDERRILESGPSGIRVISREPLFEREATNVKDKLLSHVSSFDGKDQCDASANGRAPITCEQHDYLEIACTYRLAIAIDTMDGAELVLTPRDTKVTSDKVEWLIGLRDPDRTEVRIRTDNIASIRAVNPNPHFDTVVFKRR